MQWFKTRYVQSMEKEISRLQTELAGLRVYNNQLIDRLLAKNGVHISMPQEPSKEAIENMISGQDIFADIEENGVLENAEGFTDNRKQKFDEFVS